MKQTLHKIPAPVSEHKTDAGLSGHERPRPERMLRELLQPRPEAVSRLLDRLRGL